MHAIIFSTCDVAIARIVKTGSTKRAELNLPLDDAHHTDNLMRIDLALLSGKNRHEVCYLGNSGIRKKAGKENICVRKIQLFRTQIFKLGLNAECAAFFIVKQCRKYRRRIKIRETEKIDRAFHAD